MSSTRIRLALRVVIPSLLVVSGVAHARPERIPEPTDLELPVTIDQVWYRGEKKPLFGGAKLTGDLTIGSEALEVRGRKKDVTIPMRSILGLSLGKMRGDVDTDWVVLEVDVQGATAIVGLRDGRKFGYGLQTRKLYDVLKTAMRQLGVARYDVPEGYETFESLEDQFVMAIPEGWSWYSLSLIEVDSRTRLGATVFSAEPMVEAGSSRRDVEALQRRLAGVDAGRARAFVVDRREAWKGMTCDGFAPSVEPLVREWASEIALGRSGRGAEPVRFGNAETTSIGGCTGLRMTARSTGAEGEGPQAEVYAVARSGEIVFFVRRATDLADDAAWFDTAISTFRFAPSL